MQNFSIFIGIISVYGRHHRHAHNNTLLLRYPDNLERQTDHRHAHYNTLLNGILLNGFVHFVCYYQHNERNGALPIHPLASLRASRKKPLTTDETLPVRAHNVFGPKNRHFHHHTSPVPIISYWSIYPPLEMNPLGDRTASR